ncbi:unnamed protein product, partial [Discosporangium mesarthrocarpum]
MALEGTVASRIESVLLRANTVLEAFGNAKTIRNDNSSRFGKYIKLQYDGAFRLVGAETEHFLLEKSRLVKVDNNERGYHIFYQVAQTMACEDRAAELFLGAPSQFQVISEGNCLEVSDDVDDAAEFKQTEEALDIMGFTRDEKDAMFKLLAALLHMGNLHFKAKQKCTMVPFAYGPDILGFNSTENQATETWDRGGGEEEKPLIRLSQLAQLLGVSEDEFVHRVVWRGMSTPILSYHEIPLNSVQAKDNLGALMKHLYGQLFAWVVRTINQCHNERVDTQKKDNGGGALKVKSFIGILDIFGFEIMTTNSFEQLCINYANEILQRQFNHHIFVLEQEEYAQEGLDIASIPFRDNQPIIDLIAKKPLGLMIILEDQMLTGRKAHATNNVTDRSILDLYHQEHHRRKPHPNYEKPRLESDQFILKHFAGQVTYDVEGFLEKNNDSLQDDLRALMIDSTEPFVRELVAAGESGRFELAAGNDHGDVDSGRRENRKDAISAGAQEDSSGVFPPKPPSSSTEGTGRGGRVDKGWRNRKAGDTRLANAATVSNVFRKHLNSLVARLSDTEPHYVRCIKPNASKAPGGWSSHLVIQQLRYSGVLEVVRIRHEAFPNRMSYVEFYRRFKHLATSRSREYLPTARMTEEKAKSCCPDICSATLQEAEYQFGKSKVFLRAGAVDKVYQALHAKHVECSTVIQATWRKNFAWKKAKREGEAATKLQASRRQSTAVRSDNNTSQVAIARIARGFLAKRRMEQLSRAAIVLGGAVRAYNARKTQERLRKERETRRVIRLQAVARMLLATRARTRARKGVTTIAASWRMRSAVLAKRVALRRVTAPRSRCPCFGGGRVGGMSSHTSPSLNPGRHSVRTMLLPKHHFLSSFTSLQALVRMFLVRNSYLCKRMAALRVQRALRGWSRNRELETHVTYWPELIFLRDRYDPNCSYTTLLHAACQSGSMDMVTLLEPFPSDVLERDRRGDTCVHHAAAAANYDLIKYLAHRVNMDVVRALEEEESKANHRRTISRPKVRYTIKYVAAVILFRVFHEALLFPVSCTHIFQVSTNMNVFKHTRLERLRDARMSRAKDKAWDNKDGSGFLRKRRETDRWLRRWCVLTESSLLYYRKKTDSRPSKIIKLDNAMLKKSNHVDFAFEIHTPDLLDRKNKEGRLYFAASGEEELQRWMVPLRVMVAMYQFRHDKRRKPMEYVDLLGRASMARLRNKAGETPLHAVATLLPSGPYSRELARSSPCASQRSGPNFNPLSSPFRSRMVAWLVEMGADPNEADDDGGTPLHRAVENCNMAAGSVLVQRGGDASLERPSDGRTAVEIAVDNGEKVANLMVDPVLGYPGHYSRLPPPGKLFGFTYVSFFMEKTTVKSTARIACPFITASVYNGKGKLTEPQQDIVLPSIVRPNYLWWARMWHMQTPLETLGQGSFVTFELKDQGTATTSTTVAWAIYHLDLDEVNSRTETLSTYEPPFDPTLGGGLAKGAG